MSRPRRTSDFLGLTKPTDAPRPGSWQFLIIGVFCSICGLIALRIFGG